LVKHYFKIDKYFIKKFPLLFPLYFYKYDYKHDICLIFNPVRALSPDRVELKISITENKYNNQLPTGH
jgi:hypothetical protein